MNAKGIIAAGILAAALVATPAVANERFSFGNGSFSIEFGKPRHESRGHAKSFIRSERSKLADVERTIASWRDDIRNIRHTIRELKDSGLPRHARRDVIQELRSVIRSLKDAAETARPAYISGLRLRAEKRFSHRADRIVGRIINHHGGF